MKRRSLPLLRIAGALLLVVSVVWIVAVQVRTQSGMRHRTAVLSYMDSVLEERTDGTAGENPAAAMPALQIDGVDYAALLEIPAFDLRLPVRNTWDSNRLVYAPARFTGSVYDNTLVIGGADHALQFGFCSEIELATVITVTDMTGKRFSYAVSRVDRAKHAEAAWLTDDAYDLTLFCHDVYAMEYVAVRCTAE